MSNRHEIHWAVVIGVYGVLLSLIYYDTILWLITHDWIRGDYDYCYLIPAILIYLIWEKRKNLTMIPSSPSWAGLFPLTTGIIFYWLGNLGGEFYISYLSSWLIIIGLCWLHMGWQKLKVIWFPVVMILAMFPLPNFLNTKITLKFKLLSSQLGVWLMQIWGMSAYREGNIIDLGFTRLQVVDACSGLRYLFPLIILGVILAYFWRAKLWKRLILVVSTVPLSIITNSLRIALTGALYELWGPEVAEGFFHGFSGWFIFMFSFGILLVEMWGLNKIIPEKGAEQSGVVGKKTREAKTQNSKFKIQNSFFSPQFIVAVILLGSTLALSYGVEFREKIPMTRSFAAFPLKIGKWVGTREKMDQKIIDALDLSDYVIIDYKEPGGKSINFYVAYYESQSKGKSIHSPSTCLPASGWIFNQAGEIRISTPGYHDGSIPVRRAYMQKGAYRQLSYYWFPQRDRILTNAYQLKIYNFWDALIRHRTDGALVRVITPIYEQEKIEEADKRLQEFIREVLPVLDQFLPTVNG